MMAVTAIVRKLQLIKVEPVETVASKAEPQVIRVEPSTVAS